jgi:hypothetical protein
VDGGEQVERLEMNKSKIFWIVCSALFIALVILGFILNPSEPCQDISCQAHSIQYRNDNNVTTQDDGLSVGQEYIALRMFGLFP